MKAPVRTKRLDLEGIIRQLARDEVVRQLAPYASALSRMEALLSVDRSPRAPGRRLPRSVRAPSARGKLGAATKSSPPSFEAGDKVMYAEDGQDLGGMVMRINPDGTLVVERDLDLVRVELAASSVSPT